MRHLRLSFGKRGVWSDLINAKRICRDAVVHIDQRNELKGSGVPAPEGLSRLPVAWRLPVWPVVDKLLKKLCNVWDRLVNVSRCFRSSALQRSGCTPVLCLAILFPRCST